MLRASLVDSLECCYSKNKQTNKQKTPKRSQTSNISISREPAENAGSQAPTHTSWNNLWGWGQEALINSVCWFPWCKFSQHGRCQVITVNVRDMDSFTDQWDSRKLPQKYLCELLWACFSDLYFNQQREVKKKIRGNSLQISSACEMRYQIFKNYLQSWVKNIKPI